MPTAVTVLEESIRSFEFQQDVARRLNESWKVTSAALILSPIVIYQGLPAAELSAPGLLGLAAAMHAMRWFARHARDAVIEEQNERLNADSERLITEMEQL